MSSEADAMQLMGSIDVPHGQWVIYDVKNKQLAFRCTGNGVESLRNELGDDQACFALISLRTTLEGIPDQARGVFIDWKGPNAKGMLKVRVRELKENALEVMRPHHGELEAVGKTEFTEEIILKRWGMNSGSHVIN
ncbi:ADF-H domain-containing protein [Entamoeba marina]